jgi:hypothetical protein
MSAGVCESRSGCGDCCHEIIAPPVRKPQPSRPAQMSSARIDRRAAENASEGRRAPQDPPRIPAPLASHPGDLPASAARSVMPRRGARLHGFPSRPCCLGVPLSSPGCWPALPVVSRALALEPDAELALRLIRIGVAGISAMIPKEISGGSWAQARMVPLCPSVRVQPRRCLTDSRMSAATPVLWRGRLDPFFEPFSTLFSRLYSTIIISALSSNPLSNLFREVFLEQSRETPS